MYPNNWANYGPSQCAAVTSLVPAIRNPIPSQLYPYGGVVLPPVPVVLQKQNEAFKMCPSYTYMPPPGTYQPGNIDYMKGMANSNVSYPNNYDTSSNYNKNSIKDVQDYSISDFDYANDVNTTASANDNESNNTSETADDPLRYYLTLPKELFPSPKRLALDPNPMIDEFCQIANIERHLPWLLDLEFGVPIVQKVPTPKPIPMYNIQLNCVNCLNAPDQIHPDFERCDDSFKRVLLFYYDCIVSMWYKGYIAVTHDYSVENFQLWLALPVQRLGMCWA